MRIEINNSTWEVAIVPNTNPELIVEGNAVTGATWLMQQRIYLSADLTKDTAKGIIAHELAHAFLCSTQIRLAEDAKGEHYSEEEMCNFIAMYGEQILNLTYEVYDELYGKD